MIGNIGQLMHLPMPAGPDTSIQRPAERMTATEVLERQREFYGAIKPRPRLDLQEHALFMNRVLGDPKISAAFQKHLMDALVFGQSLLWIPAERQAPEPPPAKPHPLQKMSEQPNGWGQSMWRPWEP